MALRFSALRKAAHTALHHHHHSHRHRVHLLLLRRVLGTDSGSGSRPAKTAAEAGARRAIVAKARKDAVLAGDAVAAANLKATASAAAGFGGSGAGGNVAERRMAKWLADGGHKNLKGHGKPLAVDHHRTASMVVGATEAGAYNMAKTMAANKILPPSVERRKEVENDWRELKAAMVRQRKAYTGSSWVASKAVAGFRESIAALNKKVKRCNEALISDSFTFGQGAALAGKHLLLFDADQVLRDVDSGKMDKEMNQTVPEKIAALEAEMQELRGQVWDSQNGPRPVLNRIDRIRTELRELSQYKHTDAVS